MIPLPSLSPSLSPYARRKNIIMGSPGYTDPVYLITGIASKKNDIYSFGIVVLELVMGLEAFFADKGQVLPSMVVQMTKDADCMDVGELTNMVDLRLRGDFNVEEARALIGLVRLCLDESTPAKPTASRMRAAWWRQ
ncbi:probable receptor-like protein kinase At4g10390 [Eucalyptus grandis]|uniref:probable receptor-like protein kinase At4g10390 n=1 Tax=Eucalyptus grandis TaxID=71139 RepID=UPI00192EF0AB|nr:probable receptor-like protein kinase At4g10390 [Eucalyptus grandis]